MLFDEILDESGIENEAWKKEIEKWLIYIKGKGELDRFKPRLQKMEYRKIKETLTEISSAYLLEEILNYKITDWEVDTVTNSNVEFTIKIDSKDIYCEVKSPSWQSELSDKEKVGKRKNQGKYKKNEVRFFGHKKNIRYAIKKAYPKFSKDCYNLVIIQDDLIVPILNFPTDIQIRIALYEDTGKNDKEIGYFAGKDYENVGGVFLIDINPGEKETIYKCKFYENPHALKSYNLPCNIN